MDPKSTARDRRFIGPEGRDYVAASVNLAWQLEKERLEREQRRADPVEVVDQRFERIEAAIYSLAAMVTACDRRSRAVAFAQRQTADKLKDVELAADYAVERVDGES